MVHNGNLNYLSIIRTLLHFYTANDTCFHFRDWGTTVMWRQAEGLIRQMYSKGRAMYLFQKHKVLEISFHYIYFKSVKLSFNMHIV